MISLKIGQQIWNGRFCIKFQKKPDGRVLSVLMKTSLSCMTVCSLVTVNQLVVGLGSWICQKLHCVIFLRKVLKCMLTRFNLVKRWNLLIMGRDYNLLDGSWTDKRNMRILPKIFFFLRRSALLPHWLYCTTHFPSALSHCVVTRDGPQNPAISHRVISFCGVFWSWMHT